MKLVVLVVSLGVLVSYLLLLLLAQSPHPRIHGISKYVVGALGALLMILVHLRLVLNVILLKVLRGLMSHRLVAHLRLLVHAVGRLVVLRGELLLLGLILNWLLLLAIGGEVSLLNLLILQLRSLAIDLLRVVLIHLLPIVRLNLLALLSPRTLFKLGLRLRSSGSE